MNQMKHLPIGLPAAFIDALSYADSLENVLAAAANWLPRLVGADRGKVTYFDGPNHIHHNFQIHPDDRNWALGVAFDQGSTGFFDRITSNPLFMNRAELIATGIPDYKWLAELGMNSFLSAPLKSGDTTVGVISLTKEMPDGFHHSHAAYLMTFGRLVASQAGLMQQARNTARLAETDMLTGVANRARLMRVLNGPQALHIPDKDGRRIGALQIDLDHFKEVNDTHGHAVGDAVLCHAANMMRQSVGPKDLVARTGGDEFVVITRSDPEGAHLRQLGERIVAAVSSPIQVGNVRAKIGASVGTAMAEPGERSADRLIGNADIALYQVKRAGRGNVRAYCSQMRVAADQRQSRLIELHEAVKNTNFIPYFQPQVSLITGHFSGFEILARWCHPSKGIVDPDSFIELSAEAGLSDQIDSIVREKGLAAMHDLRTAGWTIPRMSFNAGTLTLGNASLAQNLLAEVLSMDLNPSDVVLEIRQTDLAGLQKDAVCQNLSALCQAGFKIEMDDFGAGYASLSTLPEMSISALKIDKSVISALPDRKSETILRAILAMAKELDLQVVAEGVETAAQFSMLRKYGCDFAQGYGVSKPLPLNELIAFMKGYGQAPVALAAPTDVREEVPMSL